MILANCQERWLPLSVSQILWVELDVSRELQSSMINESLERDGCCEENKVKGVFIEFQRGQHA